MMKIPDKDLGLDATELPKKRHNVRKMKYGLSYTCIVLSCIHFKYVSSFCTQKTVKAVPRAPTALNSNKPTKEAPKTVTPAVALPIGKWFPGLSSKSQLTAVEGGVIAKSSPSEPLSITNGNDEPPSRLESPSLEAPNEPVAVPPTPPSPKVENKFSFQQRIDSVKSLVVGGVAGGVALSPVTALHDVLLGGGGPAQWEFDTDMGSIEAALFAIVYRYVIRTDDNPMLNQGVIGAFCIVRTLSRIQVPRYCSFAPLDCGSPLGYYDWNMIFQAVLSGAESVAMFGAAAYAMDFMMRKGFISRFP